MLEARLSVALYSPEACKLRGPHTDARFGFRIVDGAHRKPRRWCTLVEVKHTACDAVPANLRRRSLPRRKFQSSVPDSNASKNPLNREREHGVHDGTSAIDVNCLARDEVALLRT